MQEDVGLWFNLHSLIGGTTVHIFLYKLGYSGPLVVVRDEFIGLPSSWITCSYGVVVHFHDVFLEFEVVGDVDVTPIEDESIFIIPVFKTL